MLIEYAVYPIIIAPGTIHHKIRNIFFVFSLRYFFKSFLIINAESQKKYMLKKYTDVTNAV